MPNIRVIRSFYFTANPSIPARLFAPGNHTLTDEEAAHWFIQGCFRDGLLEEAAPTLADLSAAIAKQAEAEAAAAEAAKKAEDEAAAAEAAKQAEAEAAAAEAAKLAEDEAAAAEAAKKAEAEAAAAEAAKQAEAESAAADAATKKKGK